MSDHRWIQTYRGHCFDPFGPPALWTFDARDLAHHLSLVNRYAGATERAYSVAEHSVRVSRLAQDLALEQGFTEEGAEWVGRWGLVHDAAEAYLCDLPGPVKRDPRFAFYREAEARILAFLAERLGLAGPCPELVGEVDKWLPSLEAPALMRPGTGEASGGAWASRWDVGPSAPALRKLAKSPFHRIYSPLSARDAEEAWLARFRRLWPGVDVALPIGGV